MCRRFSPRIPDGGVTDLGIGLVSAGCHPLAGKLGNGLLGAKFIPPHPGRVHGHPLQQQICHWESPAVEIFKTRLDKVLYSLL